MRDLSALLEAGRLERYSRLLVACYGLAMLAILLTSSGGLTTSGKPIGADFITFWSGGRLALEGHAADAFDAARIFAMQRIAVPGSGFIFLWHYPPTFQLIAVPLATLPYMLSYYIFVVLSLVLFVAALRPLVPWRQAGALLLALPGTFICVLHGQNSLISAALLATAIIAIDRRPILAGICIGLLAYKPQLGALFPLVLAATGRWRVMGIAAATVSVFAAVSLLAFGAEPWTAFLRNLDTVREVVETGQLPWEKMPSAFVLLRLLGVPQSAAYAGQILAAASAVAVTVQVWRRCGPTLPAGATLVAGTLLLTPYTFDYEMATTAIPLAIIARQLVRHGASERERIALLVLAAAPLTMGSMVDKTGVQFGFLALAAIFVWSARLALSPRRADVPAAAAMTYPQPA